MGNGAHRECLLGYPVGSANGKETMISRIVIILHVVRV